MYIGEKEIREIEDALKERGYRKIMSAKAEMSDDYEWYKAFYDQEDELKYQTFFCFYDFTKYQSDYGWGVSIVIIPESCRDDVGRRDMHLSVDWTADIDRVEKCAEAYYEFIKKVDKNEL